MLRQVKSNSGKIKKALEKRKEWTDSNHSKQANFTDVMNLKSWFWDTVNKHVVSLMTENWEEVSYPIHIWNKLLRHREEKVLLEKEFIRIRNSFITARDLLNRRLNDCNRESSKDMVKVLYMGRELNRINLCVDDCSHY
jgi:hypothetical protein